jgi:hypothetical protein
MLTADNAYIADIYNTERVFISLTKFFLTKVSSLLTRTKEQPMLTNKKKFYENCTALRCYHLGGEKLAQLCANITFLVIL